MAWQEMSSTAAGMAGALRQGGFLFGYSSEDEPVPHARGRARLCGKGDRAFVGLDPGGKRTPGGAGSVLARFAEWNAGGESFDFDGTAHGQMSSRRMRSPKFSPVVRA